MFGAICMFVVGLIMLVFKDLMWEWTEYNNRASGIENSDRTEEWEASINFSGFFIIFMSIMMCCYAQTSLQG